MLYVKPSKDKAENWEHLYTQHLIDKKSKKLNILILCVLITQSCTFIRQPNKYPLIVTSVYQSSEPGYDIYVIRDYNPSTQGWGNAAMYIEFKDKRNKFKMGDTIVFSKK